MAFRCEQLSGLEAGNSVVAADNLAWFAVGLGCEQETAVMIVLEHSMLCGVRWGAGYSNSIGVSRTLMVPLRCERAEVSLFAA